MFCNVRRKIADRIMDPRRMHRRKQAARYEVFQLASKPARRKYPKEWTCDWSITGMTLVQSRAAVECIKRQANRDQQGNLLPGHTDAYNPNIASDDIVR